MRRVRPGPEREAFIRRIREQWAADEAALNRVPFPIYGLTPPFPSPVSLSSFETINGQVSSVGLQYGAPAPAQAPLVTVRTEAFADRGSIPVVEALRGLLSELDGAEQQPSSRRAEPEAAEVRIDGGPHPIRVLEGGRTWAAVAELTSDDAALLVAVVARDWPLADVTLARVTDLEPFFAGRRQRVEAALARADTRPGPEDWDLPAAKGLTGHRALADMMIAMTREQLASGFPHQRSPLADDYGKRWEIATRAQMALARQGRDAAEDAVHSMINHLCQLVQSANWFSNADLADGATAETLDYVAYGRDVPSAEAQHAWSRYWGLRDQHPPAFESLSSAEEAWLAAWQRWVDQRQVR